MNLLEITDWNSATEKNRLSILSRPSISRSEDLNYKIKEIIDNVHFAGDEALKEMTLKYDNVSLSDFKMTLDEIDQAIKQTPQSIKKAIKTAIANVTKFHTHKMEASIESIEVVPGVLCGEMIKPIHSVGLYVPSGNNPLTSTAIMLGVPSLLARCPRRILCSPPNQEGLVDRNIVTAASACGISDIY
ncbi:MAG: histidinol dehydrogenase, partial [Pseudomonadota bacterium]|nr:histidinol dehydrogenase [Pseudomonadota bacterium]